MAYIIFSCITVPMLLLLPLLETRSRYIVGFMLAGIVMALCSYEINSLLFLLSGLDPQIFSQVVPPVVEELLKALPVLVYAVLLDDRRERVLAIAMAVGVGFAVLENTVLLAEHTGAVTLAWAAARGFSASLMHGLCTMAVGMGITYIKKQKKLFYTGTFGLLSIAITVHAMFNMLIQSRYDSISMVMPAVLYGLLYALKKWRAAKLSRLIY